MNPKQKDHTYVPLTLSSNKIIPIPKALMKH